VPLWSTPTTPGCSRRLAIKEVHLREMLELFGSTGDDPQLDLMIAWFILITGARQEGLLNLKLGRLDPDEWTVRSARVCRR
jgi:hypothetical protein